LTDKEFDILRLKPVSSKNNLDEAKFDRKNIIYEDSDILVINKDP
jgi:23S rRNA-/tRNA-specific pseudouridylate synthase